MSEDDLLALKNPSEAFCIDFRMDNNSPKQLAWQLHEGSHELAAKHDTSFGGLDGFERIVKSMKHIMIVNTGYMYDASLSAAVYEVAISMSHIAIRKASTVFVALFGSSSHDINHFRKHLIQFESITGRFDYEYILQIIPSYKDGQTRAALIVGI